MSSHGELNEPSGQVEVVVLGLAVSGGVFAANGSDHAPAIIALIGAVTVAFIAARTASRRLVRQLDAEADRADRDRAAESERHHAQRTHERDLADLADLRRLLDEASGELTKSVHAARDLMNGDGVYSGRLEAHFAHHVSVLADVAGRLRVRLGVADPVTLAFGEACSSAAQIRSLEREAVAPDVGDELRRFVNSHLLAADDFWEAAAGRVGSRLPRHAVGLDALLPVDSGRQTGEFDVYAAARAAGT
jgi:hypothetical protein